MPELLQATDILKRFGGVTALAGVDVELAENEILGLIGPNGSGKTTLVNCISGVLKIDQGRVRLRDRTITRSSRTRRAKSGLARTFQSPRLFTELSVRENVETGLNSFRRGRTDASTSRWIGFSNASSFPISVAQVVASLPYGYQRRVEIARALVGEPAVLLLDEPAAGLNDVETADLRELLLDIRTDAAARSSSSITT